MCNSLNEMLDQNKQRKELCERIDQVLMALKELDSYPTMEEVELRRELAEHDMVYDTAELAEIRIQIGSRCDAKHFYILSGTLTCTQLRNAIVTEYQRLQALLEEVL